MKMTSVFQTLMSGDNDSDIPPLGISEYEWDAVMERGFVKVGSTITPPEDEPTDEELEAEYQEYLEYMQLVRDSGC